MYVFAADEANGDIFNNEKSAGLPVLEMVLPVFGRQIPPTFYHIQGEKNGVLLFSEGEGSNGDVFNIDN